MEPSYDNAGFFIKVCGNVAYGKDVCLTKWNEQIYVHINDNSKCWENQKFDKTKSKTVSLKWEQAQKLRDCLNDMEHYAGQILAEQVFCCFCFVLVVL